MKNDIETQDEFIRYNELKELIEKIQELFSIMSDDERKIAVKYSLDRIKESKKP